MHASQTELTTLFAKYDTIIGCTGMTLPPGTQTKIAHAALEARIPKFVPWQFGLDYDAIEKNTKHDLFSEQVAIRNTLRAQSVTDWVIASTSMFLSFIFESDFGLVDLKEGEVEAIGSWENTITVTAVEDIGKVVSELLFVTPEETGVVYISGDSISMRRLASLVEKLLGREIEKSLKTVPELEQKLVDDPENKMGKYRTTFASGIGCNWDAASTYTARRNLDTISVEAWAKKNLKILPRTSKHALVYSHSVIWNLICFSEPFVACSSDGTVFPNPSAALVVLGHKMLCEQLYAGIITAENLLSN